LAQVIVHYLRALLFLAWDYAARNAAIVSPAACEFYPGQPQGVGLMRAYAPQRNN
jgi:hypothetical protein